MARKKSQNDIIAQAKRMKAQAAASDNPERYRKIGNIAIRYIENIARTRSYQNARRKADLEAEYIQGDRTKVARANRKYAQSTYMGNSNG